MSSWLMGVTLQCNSMVGASASIDQLRSNFNDEPGDLVACQSDVGSRRRHTFPCELS
jgi:hypothetical protein